MAQPNFCNHFNGHLVTIGRLISRTPFETREVFIRRSASLRTVNKVYAQTHRSLIRTGEVEVFIKGAYTAIFTFLHEKNNVVIELNGIYVSAG